MSYFYLIAAMLIVGSSVIVGKIITHDLPLFLASALRFLTASLFLLPLGVYKKGLFHLSGKDRVIIITMSFCGQILFTVLLLLGLRYTSSVSAGTLTSTTPFFMALISFIFLKERFSPIQICGLLMSFCSIIFIGMDAFKLIILKSESSDWLGNLLILTAVAGEAVFLLFAKKLNKNISGIDLTAILSLIGVVMCLPMAIFEAVNFDFAMLTLTDIFAILYFGVIYTDLAYVCWFRGIVGASAAMASVCTAVMPLSAAFLSTFYLKENISVWQLISLLSAVVSILLLAAAEQRRGKRL